MADTGAVAESDPRGEVDEDTVRLANDADGVPVSAGANDADNDSKLSAVRVDDGVSDALLKGLPVLDTELRELTEEDGFPVEDAEIRGLVLTPALGVACDDVDGEAVILRVTRELADTLTDRVPEAQPEKIVELDADRELLADAVEQGVDVVVEDGERDDRGEFDSVADDEGLRDSSDEDVADAKMSVGEGVIESGTREVVPVTV